MTTIAYRDGVMAGDGRETSIEEGESSFTLSDDCVKIHRLPDGRLFGGSRGSEEIDRLLAALRDGKEKWPTPKLEDINAMVVDLKGRIWLYEGNMWIRCKDKYYAVGSGARFAFPAMDAHATAVQAVRIGIKRDPFSGGTVTVLKLHP